MCGALDYFQGPDPDRRNVISQGCPRKSAGLKALDPTQAPGGAWGRIYLRNLFVFQGIVSATIARVMA